MTIDMAEHIAKELLENGYGPDKLANYSVDELQDIICGSIVNAMDKMLEMDREDPDRADYIEHSNHFENALRQEIQHRVEAEGSSEGV